ncbi:ATP-grasp domain-containing protein, partial [Endozoicomonas numazuensis]|uniref:ATP-grasp domain-containing protein n=1 Tax=Endozoicomonas numazuensis TaxID=1137799 RepID=UPI00054D154D
MPHKKNRLPKIGLLYLDHVLRFFDKSNFRGWPDKIETVVYHWGNDKERFINEVKRKKIEVLIGNIPATAYETFREIARALPDVQFVPSMDAQFANKSKENVTHFCEKYNLPIPKTRIFYDRDEGRAFLRNTDYPKIIKRSYGPSNYGGFYVHKVDSEIEALELMAEKQYYPLYIQDFVPMKADIRVMLIGHKPVCAFWRRPPEGEWLTNTSQGGSMDYMDVPKEALEVAVRASKAANAEYWACDIAVSHDDQYSILECATAFAAFPYIRDWIGQYLMWKLSAGRIRCPHLPLYNWEELGKISSSVLRTMRYIHFGRSAEAQAMTDTAETFTRMDKDGYPIIDTHHRYEEEWPSEVWNRQDNYRQDSSPALSEETDSIDRLQAVDTGIEDAVSVH